MNRGMMISITAAVVEREAIGLHQTPSYLPPQVQLQLQLQLLPQYWPITSVFDGVCF
jgi:hypothetical protein